MNKDLQNKTDKEYQLYLQRKLRVSLFEKVKVTPAMRETLAYNWIALKIAFKDFISYFAKGVMK